MKILGLNIYHADSSAAVFDNEKILVAIEEERITRVKHAGGFPFESIKYCLESSQLKIDDIDQICINYNSSYNLLSKIFFTFKNLIRSYKLIKNYLFSKKLNLKKNFEIFFKLSKKINFHFCPHHISHVYSAIVPSGFEDGICLSYDGSGDFSTVEIYEFKKFQIKLINKINFPHSLGLLYQTITQYLGFDDYGDEYKVMGMAAYGKPLYEKEIRNLITVKNGEIKLNLNFFNLENLENISVHQSGIKFNKFFYKTLDHYLGGQRFINDEIEIRHFNIASSLQKVFEDSVLEICNFWNKKNYKNLCITGGCAFNTLANGKIYHTDKFKNIFIPFNPGDAGGAIGSVFHFLENKKLLKRDKSHTNPYLGKLYVKEDIMNSIKEFEKYKKSKIVYTHYENFDDLINETSNLLKKKNIIGWFQDNSEFGPRALGNRSILANPSISNVKELINKIIKKREEFRPFAPSVLKEHQEDFFNVQENFNSRYMNLVGKVKNSKKKLIPGVVHVDDTSRIHSLDEKSNRKYYKLLKEFYKKTNLPILLNTSLNIKEPICETPLDVLRSFIDTEINYIILGNIIIKNNDK